jgi:hypothetical protein
MEGTTIIEAYNIMGTNFIGPTELEKISNEMRILNLNLINSHIPNIPYSKEYLKKIHKDYILILGIPYTYDNQPLSINKMREYFGFNPEEKEPCFYNQDWYIKEDFANKTTLELKWYLIRKNIIDDSKGVDPNIYLLNFNIEHKLPSAILTAFTFFTWYFHTKGEIIWENEYVWCNDKDHNGDRIYTGRYKDIEKINKNGFSIHRHLSIRPCYGISDELIIP